VTATIKKLLEVFGAGGGAEAIAWLPVRSNI